MNTSRRLFAVLCLTLLGSSFAQPVPPEGPVPPTTIRLSDDVEGKLTWRGGPSVTLTPVGAGVDVTCRLSDDALSTLLAQRKAALAVERTRRSYLEVGLADEEPTYLDSTHPKVAPLFKALIGLREDLYYPPRDLQTVTLRTSDFWDYGPQRELVVANNGSARLIYRLGKRRWSLPAITLTREERAALRDEVRSLRRLDRRAGNRLDETKDYLELTLKGGAWQVRFYGSGVEGLRAQAAGMGRVLKQIDTRLFTFNEQVLAGHVEDGRIRCGELSLAVEGPLVDLALAGNGAEVVVLALVRNDGTWGTALRLVAHEASGWVVWPPGEAQRYVSSGAGSPPTGGILGGLRD